MERCLLCGVNDANDTGSHVIPHFLLKSMASTQPEKKRGANELIFKVTEKETDVYIGREVLPEKIAKVLGKNPEEIDLEDNIDTTTVNNKWCTECEKKLSILENKAAELYKDIEPSEDRIYNLENQGPLFRLFIYSILWRIKATENIPTNISAECGEHLRQILMNCLNHDPKIMIQNCQDNKLEINRFPLILGRSFQLEASANFLMSINNSEPETFILNDLVVNFSCGKILNSEHVYPALKNVDKEVINQNSDNLNVIRYSDEEYTEVSQIAMQPLIKRRSLWLRLTFIKKYVEIFRKTPNQKELNSFLEYYFQITEDRTDLKNELFEEALAQWLNSKQ